ncbi:MAG: trigger factor [Planctomycetes bacterium]|nr:trigger factor [Planctomycetota bacterium]
MQATINDAGTLRKQVTVTYSEAEVASRQAAVLKKLSGQVKLDGFRPGKSSQSVVAKRYGNAAVQQAREELADEGFNQALKQHSLKPIGPITNESLKSEKGLEVVVSFDVKPTITLPEPSAITVTKDEVTIAEADVQAALDNLCKRAGTQGALEANEIIIADDGVTLTGTVTVDGKEVRKLHDFHHLVGGYSLLGTKPEDVIKLFDGKKVGDTLEFTTTLPKTFSPKDAAEKEAKISVTIQTGQRQRAAVADEALATRLGVESLAVLKTRLSDQLKQQKETELHQKQINEITETLLTKVQVDLPPRLLENALKENLEQRLAKAKEEGKSADELAKLSEEIKSEVEKGLKRHLIVDAVAEQHQVQVTREDLESQIQMAAMRSNRKPQDIADQLQKSGQVNQVVSEIREAKALEVLLDKVLGRFVANPGHGETGHVHGPDCNH